MFKNSPNLLNFLQGEIMKIAKDEMMYDVNSPSGSIENFPQKIVWYRQNNKVMSCN